jgi:hypothetical protein
MPRHCSVCAHPERPAIDHALVAGDAAQRISARYCSLSRPAIQRHKAEHLPQTMVKAKESEDVDHALDIVKQLKAINGASLQILNEARQAGNGELVLKAVDRVQRQIELQAKLLGELDERAQVNVLLAPLPLGTPYPHVARRVADITANLDRRATIRVRPTIYLDATSCCRAPPRRMPWHRSSWTMRST